MLFSIKLYYVSVELPRWRERKVDWDRSRMSKGAKAGNRIGAESSRSFRKYIGEIVKKAVTAKSRNIGFADLRIDG